jgi:mono/diheme cytochrome c family protein
MGDGGVRNGRIRIWPALALVAVTVPGCSPMDDLLVAIFGRSMRDQPSIGWYENPLLPPEGAVPFAAGNFPATEGEFALGQSEGGIIPPPVLPLQLLLEEPIAVDLVNPVQPGEVSLARGEVMFERTCAPCHGPLGDGAGPVTAAGVPSISILTDEARGRTDGYLYSIIRVGRGAMPPYAHQITHFDRWHIVNYVRQLQAAQPAAPGAGAGAAGEDR